MKRIIDGKEEFVLEKVYMDFEKAHYVARLQRWKEGSCFDVPFLFWQEPTLHCDSGTLLQSLFKEIKMNRPLVG